MGMGEGGKCAEGGGLRGVKSESFNPPNLDLVINPLLCITKENKLMQSVSFFFAII